MKKRRFQFGGNIEETVPASRPNIDQRTPSGVRSVSSPVAPVKSDVQGAMKHGGELKKMMSKRSKVKRMAVGGMSAPMGKRGAPPPGQGKGGSPGAQGKGGAPGQGMGQGQGKGPVPGGFMGGGAGQGQGKGTGPGGKPDGMRYPMGGPGGLGLGAGGMPMGGGMGGRGGMGPGEVGGGPAYLQDYAQRMGARTGQDGGQFGMGPMGVPLSDASARAAFDQQMAGYPADQRDAVRAMITRARPAGMKKGGKVSASSYNDMTGGAGGAMGRLQKTSIASKTVSQKLKKGGKVKGYAGGNVVTADDNKTFNKAFADARRDKADAFMWHGTKYTTKLASGEKGDEPTYASQRAAQPGPDVDVYGDAARNRGKGGGRGGPTTGGEAQMREMGLYPFGTDSNNVDTVRDEKYAKDNRGKSGGRSGTARENTNARADAAARSMESKIRKNESSMAERDAAYNSMKDDAFRAMLQRKQNTSAIGGGMGEEPVYPMNSEEMRNAASEMGATAGGMRRGGKAKMAKGGKVENFEGSAKDMAQDEKMAKARGMTLKQWEKSSADVKHDAKEGMKKGGKVKKMAKGGYASGGMSIAQDGMKGALRSKPSAMAKGGYAKGGKMTEGSPRDEARDMRQDRPQAKKAKMSMAKFENSAKDIDKMAKGGKASSHAKGCKCMACGGMAKMAKGGKVGMTFGKPLPGTKVSSQKIRSTVSTAGANMKKDGMKGSLRAKASGAKGTAMMKPLGMTKMAKGGKVRGAGIAQRGTKFIGEV